MIRGTTRSDVPDEQNKLQDQNRTNSKCSGAPCDVSFCIKASVVLSALLLFRQFPTSAAELPHDVDLTNGQGRILNFSSEVTRVYTSNPEVADVAVIDAHQIVVNAKSTGQATLAVWFQSGGGESIAVTVGFDLSPIQKLLDRAFPATR